MTRNLESNIWKYALFLIANKRVFVAILGAYYLTIPGVTAESIGVILLASSLSGFIFEIPSGYLSDKMGHKSALIMSRILMLCSSVLFLVAESLTFLILAGVVLSMGWAFHSGTGSAFLHDTLRALGREKEYTAISGKIGAIGFAIPVIFMVLVPFLVDISYKLPFLVALVIDSMGVIVAFLLVVPPVTAQEVEEVRLTTFRQVLQEGYRLHYFPFALFTALTGGALFAIGGFRAPYQVLLEVPVIWFGVLFGIGRLLASLMIAYSGAVRSRITLFGFLKFRLFLYTVLALSLSLITNVWVVITAFIIINAFQWGLSRVSNGFSMDIIRTSKFKATLLSTRALIDHLVAAVFSFGLGYTIEAVSYQFGFALWTIAFFVLLFPLYIYIIWNHKAINDSIESRK